MRSSAWQVTKANGEVMPFEEDRLIRSLQRSGASAAISRAILDEIRSEMYERIPTREIYRMAFSRLQDRSRHLASRYKLKRAIMELGPSGFPFERFVARLLEHKGYRLRMGALITGRCVTHEIDVVAEKDGEVNMIECKYHNRPGMICDVKVPLYIWARFKDVERDPGKGPEDQVRFHRAWVATNTRFSDDAIRYAACSDMRLIGWDQPAGKGLKEMVDDAQLYPITCLLTLPAKEKQRLLEQGIVLCKELAADHTWLERSGMSPAKRRIVHNEVHTLCATPLMAVVT
jgi:hypothetical protein